MVELEKGRQGFRSCEGSGWVRVRVSVSVRPINSFSTQPG